MGKIGIFWVRKDEVLRSTFDLATADEFHGVVDSPENHVDVWPRFQTRYSDLHELEYFALPRGRVVYNQSTARFTVFLDSVLMTPAIKTELLRAFSLTERTTDFARDSHYTTAAWEIDSLFE
jgi:hypothetical protein